MNSYIMNEKAIAELRITVLNNCFVSIKIAAS
jgi:hypothetical protein